MEIVALALVATKTIPFWGWDWTLADLINAAIAVATLLTFLAGFGAVVMASRANATALAAAKDASDKASAALNETKRSNELTERSIQLAHRPSLHPLKVGLMSGNKSTDTEISVAIFLRNTGTDSARAVMTDTNFVLAAPNRADVDKVTPLNRSGEIGKDLEHMFVGSQHYTPELRNSFFGGDSRGMLVLVVTYRDVFRNHYRLSVVWRYQSGIWTIEDQWSTFQKVTPENDRTWDRF